MGPQPSRVLLRRGGILGSVPAVDVLDDTFVRAQVRDVLAGTRAGWSGWLPDLVLVVAQDRGAAGLRWVATTRARRAAAAVTLRGTAEVWLEPVPGGTVVHLYVRLDLPPERGGAQGLRDRRGRGRLPDRVRRTWKRGLNQVKDQLEGEGAA